MFLSSAIITVHLENLRHNLKTLLARHPSLMPVIKADAYGHGVVAVARVLAEEGPFGGLRRRPLVHGPLPVRRRY